MRKEKKAIKFKTLVKFLSLFMEQTKIGILFSLARDIADASITLRSLLNTSR